MTEQAIDDAVANIQQILDRDYVHLEWRVLTSPPVSTGVEDELVLYVHARTRDFRSRCHVARPWRVVLAAPTLRLFVADVAAEAELLLSNQASGS